MYKMFYSQEKSISKRKYGTFIIKKFPSLVVSRNAIMLKHLIIQFLLHYLSSGCLWKVKSKRKFQTFNSTKSVHGGFKRCLFTIGNKYSDLETSGILEHWSLKRRKDCIIRQTVTLSSQIPHRSGIIMSVKSTTWAWLDSVSLRESSLQFSLITTKLKTFMSLCSNVQYKWFNSIRKQEKAGHVV